MGKVAGRTLAGQEASWDDAPGFWSTIGEHTLKYAGWGDGFDEVRFEPGAGESFVARYGRDGELVGVLAHDDDDAYERGRERKSRRRRTVELSAGDRAAHRPSLPPPARALRAAVVVPARDEEERIGACLDALAAQVGHALPRTTR